MMKIKEEIKRIIIVLMAVVILIGGYSTKVYAAKKKSIELEVQKGSSGVIQKKKQEKEYAKWKIQKINGAYIYKQKDVRLLVDDMGKDALTNNFYYNKKGQVDIRIMRNKKGRIKKIKYISKKKAKKIMENYNTAYCIDKK